MKSIIGILIGIIVLLLGWYFIKDKKDFEIGSQVQIRNLQESSFVNYINKQCEEFGNQINEIQKQEFLTNYQKQTTQFSDSIGLFKNWKGVLERLKTFDWSSDKITELTFEINIKLTEDKDMTFSVRKLIKNSALDSSLLYQQLKNLREGSTIYFDGFIAKDKENKIEYTGYNFDDESKICNPEIKFYVVSVSNTKLDFNNSPNFNKVTNIEFKTFHQMAEAVKGKLTSKELKANLIKNKNEVEPLMNSFTTNEKKYIYSLTECLRSQFNQN